MNFGPVLESEESVCRFILVIAEREIESSIQVALTNSYWADIGGVQMHLCGSSVHSDLMEEHPFLVFVRRIP